MRTVLVVLILLVGYDGAFQSFRFTKQTYHFVDGMFESVTSAM